MNVSRTRSYDNFKDNKEIPPMNSYTEKDTSDTDELYLLQQKIQYVKNDRKTKENNAMVLQHRINLLRNQEKQAVQKFENTKQKFENIINKRNKSKSKEKEFIKLEKRGNTYNNSRFMSHNASKNSFNKSNHIRHNSNQNLPLQYYENITKQEDKMRKELIEKREKLKEILMKKLMEEEKERLQLENMLANIEKEEINLIKNNRLCNYDNEIISKTLDTCYNSSINCKSENKHQNKYV